MPRLKQNISTVKRRIETSRKYNLRNTFDFIDPYPLGFGTLPEKLVYNALTIAGIEFYYLNDLTFTLPEIDFFKEYQADFYIPGTKTIIEVQGSYWHSKPAAIEADSYKLAVYESFGFNVLIWWDYEIQTNLAQLMASAGVLLNAPRVHKPIGTSNELTPFKRSKTDTSQGIRTMNARKRKPYRQKNQVSRKGLRKVKSSYESRSR